MQNTIHTLYMPLCDLDGHALTSFSSGSGFDPRQRELPFDAGLACWHRRKLWACAHQRACFPLAKCSYDIVPRGQAPEFAPGGSNGQESKPNVKHLPKTCCGTYAEPYRRVGAPHKRGTRMTLAPAPDSPRASEGVPHE